MNPPRSNRRRTIDHWSTEGSWEVGRGIYWLELPSVQRRLNQKVSSQPDLDWVRYTLGRHFAERLPLERCLSLGCGEGWLERQLAGLGAFVSCDAFDITESSIEKAQALAQQAGYNQIHYSVQNANQRDLPIEHYDAVWSAGAAHHFGQLEHVFQQVAAALKPGGLFVLHEYIGPNRFQFSPRQREVIEACHNLLPADYRRVTTSTQNHRLASQRRHSPRWWLKRIVDKLRDGDLPHAARRWLHQAWSTRSGARPLKIGPNLPSARSVQAVDPSEAIRSAEIVPLLRRYFEIIEFKPLGGSILQFLLADIAGNFQDESGEQLLEMLFVIEDTLVDSGDLGSDFAYVVAVPR